MTSPGKTPPAMKQLDTGKWVYPINSSGTEFSDEEFDSEEDALTAWRRTRVSYAKGPTRRRRQTSPVLVAVASAIEPLELRVRMGSSPILEGACGSMS